jgi:hypothetical protein
MLRCAYAHGIAEPRWEVHGNYLRTLSVSLDGSPLSLDLTQLNGEVVDFERDLGGHRNWYRIRDATIAITKPIS